MISGGTYIHDIIALKMRNMGFKNYHIDSFLVPLLNTNKAKVESKNDLFMLVSQDLELDAQCTLQLLSPDNLHRTTRNEYSLFGLHKYQIFRDEIDITVLNAPDNNLINCTLEFLRITPEPEN